MANSFQAQVDKIVVNTNAKMTALMRESVQEVIDIAQTPGPSKKSIEHAIKQGLGSIGKGKQRRSISGPVMPQSKGGKMRVDTGFLRASGQSSLNGMPTGPIRGNKNSTYNFDVSLTEKTISEFEIGSTFFFGWTASYAKYREAFDGFLASALQQWPRIVARNTERIRNR